MFKRGILAGLAIGSVVLFVVTFIAWSNLEGSPKGPYLQNVTQTSVTVMWETREAMDTLLEYNSYTLVEDTRNVMIHSVRIEGLDVDTEYDYRVCLDNDAWSDWYTFKTAPAAGASFRLVAYGDSRSAPAVHETIVQSIMGQEILPDLVVHTGDFVAGPRRPKDLNGKVLYKLSMLNPLGDDFGDWSSEEFFDSAAPMVREIPVYPVWGNHEYYLDGYRQYFDFPGGERWYAFSYGCTRFIGLDTNKDFSPGSRQYEWLIQELESEEFSSAAWQMVTTHHPPFSSTRSRPGDEEIIEHLVPLFEEHGVDIIFAGHNHNYERSFKDGVTYVTTGGGGASKYLFVDDPLEQNPYSIVRESEYHYNVLDITPEKILVNVWRPDGTTFDMFEMEQEGPA